MSDAMETVKTVSPERRNQPRETGVQDDIQSKSFLRAIRYARTETQP